MMNSLKSVSEKWLVVLYGVVIALASLAVNSACISRFYQEKLDSQLDSLKKYHD